MVEAGAAEQLPQPIWMDRNGKQVGEKDAIGCIVTHKLCHTERCFIGEEVGGNLSMKGDGHAHGRNLLTATESVLYSQAFHVEKRFTMICLAELDGSPVLCVLIIQGVQKYLAISRQALTYQSTLKAILRRVTPISSRILVLGSTFLFLLCANSVGNNTCIG